MASGPHATGLLTSGVVAALAPAVRACLSLIALAAGAELHLPELRRLRRQVACLTAAIALCSWVLVYAWCAGGGAGKPDAPRCACRACMHGGRLAAWLAHPPSLPLPPLHAPPCPLLSMRMLSSRIPFLKDLSPADASAVCTLAATLAMARSPASAVRPCGKCRPAGGRCRPAERGPSWMLAGLLGRASWGRSPGASCRMASPVPLAARSAPLAAPADCGAH